jgi:hypothetical protein
MQLLCHGAVHSGLCGKQLIFNKLFSSEKTAIGTPAWVCGIAATASLLMVCYIVVKNDSVSLGPLMRPKDSTKFKYVKTFRLLCCAQGQNTEGEIKPKPYLAQSRKGTEKNQGKGKAWVLG